MLKRNILFLFIVVSTFMFIFNCSSSLDAGDNTKTNLVEIPKISKSVITGYTYGTDWSEKVHIIIATAISGEKESNPQVHVTLPDDYVLIGGGAWVFPSGENPGALLTASYPDHNLLTWHAESKDHVSSFKHQLIGYAIGLKLTDIPRDELRKYVQIWSNTSPIPALYYPRTSVSVDSGYLLIGGGARVNWKEYGNQGNLLIASFPSGNLWYAESKDHVAHSPATITAYAIGIIPNIPNFGQLEIKQVLTYHWSDKRQYDFVTLAFDDESWVISCPGAQTNSDNGQGRLIVGIQPNITGTVVGSKDHCNASSGDTFAYAIKIRKQQ
jgi:hypothetical protein